MQGWRPVVVLGREGVGFVAFLSDTALFGLLKALVTDEALVCVLRVSAFVFQCAQPGVYRQACLSVREQRDREDEHDREHQREVEGEWWGRVQSDAPSPPSWLVESD